jgi:hypothetical protein
MTEKEMDIQEENTAFMFLEENGTVMTVALSPDLTEILIDGEYSPFRSFNEGGDRYVELSDGRRFKDVNANFLDEFSIPT